MEVRNESEEQMRASRHKGKSRRSNGPQVPPPAVVADQTGRLLIEREQEWLERLATNPASFATIEQRSPRASATPGRSLRRWPLGQSQRTTRNGAPCGPGDRCGRGPPPSG